MAKKGKEDAQNPAADQPETLDAAVPPAAVAPETETPLALGGGDASEATGQEHEGAADDAAGDGSDGHSGEVSDGEVAQGSVAAGQEPGAGAEGPDGAAGDTGGASEGLGDGAVHAIDGSADAGETGGGADPENGGADEAAENHVEDPTLAPADGIVAAAEAACFAVSDYLVEFWEFDQAQLKRFYLLAGNEHSKATNAIAALVRSIGKDRATPAVCGQQLKILGLLDDPELSDVEALIVQTFVNVLAGIDAYEAREVARLETARAEPEARKPIPIEDTTMELVDDTLDTFGGQG